MYLSGLRGQTLSQVVGSPAAVAEAVKVHLPLVNPPAGVAFNAVKATERQRFVQRIIPTPTFAAQVSTLL